MTQPQPAPADDYVRAHLTDDARNGLRRYDPEAEARQTREMPAIAEEED